VSKHLRNPLLHVLTELALPVGKGLAVLGWVQQADTAPHSCTLLFDDGSDTRIDLQAPRHQLSCINAAPHGLAFSFWLPATLLRGQQPMLAFNDQLADLSPLPLGTLDALLQHPALMANHALAMLGLARRHGAVSVQRALQAAQQAQRDERQQLLASLDQAWRIGDHVLLLGRAAVGPTQITSMDAAAKVPQRQRPLPVQLHCRAASGASTRAPASCVFGALIQVAALPAHTTLTLQLHTQTLGSFTFTTQPLEAEPDQLDTVLAPWPAVALLLLDDLRLQLRRPAQRQRVQQAADACLRSVWQNADSKVRHGNVCALGIATACALDSAGLLVIGTFARPPHTHFRAWLHGEGHAALDVSERLQFLPVPGDHARLHKHFAHADERLSFVLHAPMPTQGGERRALRVEIAGLPTLWLRLDTPAHQPRGSNEVRRVLGTLSMSDTLLHQFKPLCDAGLGAALAWLGHDPAPRATPTVEQFGVAPRKPGVSIIVPLYGRCDFMRHQLAQFCQDPDFANVDLIYVVDDPRLHTAALRNASNYQPLFQLPLRVLTYPENRGFAGANNAAVPFARAPLLLLLNSDVLPQQPGWLRSLQQALARLPGAGMVGPLLQFPEGSVQHAGMAATRQRGMPGLVFSHHPGKGTHWQGGEKPAAQAMLTGACLLLQKRDYAAVGGLDENYLVGDFEDSDFSLKLRAAGKRLYLVPKARLWHLERQSQYLDEAKTHTVRDLLTLYNAWRYQRKIAAGELPDPESSDMEA